MARTADRPIRMGETDDARFRPGRRRRSHRCVVTAPRDLQVLEPLYVSAGIVAIAEIGDKTQLLAICLAAKFRKPAPIILGILAATVLNHALAARLGFLALGRAHV